MFHFVARFEVTETYRSADGTVKLRPLASSRCGALRPQPRTFADNRRVSTPGRIERAPRSLSVYRPSKGGSKRLVEQHAAVGDSPPVGCPGGLGSVWPTPCRISPRPGTPTV